MKTIAKLVPILLFMVNVHVNAQDLDLHPLTELTKLEQLILDYNQFTDLSPLEKLTGKKQPNLHDIIIINS